MNAMKQLQKLIKMVMYIEEVQSWIDLYFLLKNLRNVLRRILQMKNRVINIKCLKIK